LGAIHQHFSAVRTGLAGLPGFKPGARRLGAAFFKLVPSVVARQQLANYANFHHLVISVDGKIKRD
jgi:hypothetical protein